MKYDLERLNEIVEKANKHGGSLYLSGLTSIPEGFNPTVGGSLDLSGLTSIPEGFNPTVGGSLDLSGLTASVTKLVNGMYVPGGYLYCDGILTHIKKEKKFGKYRYYVGKIKGRNVIFDGSNYAHCNNFSDGVADLEFKKAKDRGSDQYKSLTKDSVVSKEDAIVMYRIITGACKAGTNNFLDNIREMKSHYSIEEIIEITKGQYGADIFAKFFNGGAHEI